MRLEAWKNAFWNPVLSSERIHQCSVVQHLRCSCTALRFRDMGTNKVRGEEDQCLRVKMPTTYQRHQVIRVHPQRGDSASDRRPASVHHHPEGDVSLSLFLSLSLSLSLSLFGHIVYEYLWVWMFVSSWSRECRSNGAAREVGQGPHGWELCKRIWIPLIVSLDEAITISVDWTMWRGKDQRNCSSCYASIRRSRLRKKDNYYLACRIADAIVSIYLFIEIWISKESKDISLQ